MVFDYRLSIFLEEKIAMGSPCAVINRVAIIWLIVRGAWYGLQQASSNAPPTAAFAGTQLHWRFAAATEGVLGSGDLIDG